MVFNAALPLIICIVCVFSCSYFMFLNIGKSWLLIIIVVGLEVDIFISDVQYMKSPTYFLFQYFLH